MMWLRRWWWRRRGVRPYGYELMLDLHGCNPAVMNRPQIALFMQVLCDDIDMQREDLHFWDYEDDPDHVVEAHLEGTSAVQFIKTSNVTIHTLELMQRVYLNIFSCKDFDPAVVTQLALDWFGGRVVQEHFMPRW